MLWRLLFLRHCHEVLIRYKLLASLVTASVSLPIQGAEVKICAVKWPPFVEGEGTQIMGGLTVDILRLALAKVGHTLNMELRPYTRCLREVKAGTFDGMSDVAPRPGYLTSRGPVSVWANVIWVREDSPLKSFDGLATFKDKTVGFVRGYSYVPAVRAFEGWRKDWALTDEMNVTKLAKGRVDFIVSDILSTQFYLEKSQYKVRALEPPISTQLEYVLFHEKNGDLVKAFDQGLKAIVDDGTVDKLYMKRIGIKFTSMVKSAEK